MISVQVIDKGSGRYRLVKTIGSSSDAAVVAELVRQGEIWIKERKGQSDFDFSGSRYQAEKFLDNITQIKIQGIDLLLGRLFDQIGFDQIEDVLFRRLVLARLCYPASKLRTTDYFAKYDYLETEVQSIYRYMDKLHRTQKATVQDISFEHTTRILGGKLSIVFYDVTTLYFEIEQEDDLRKTGFSKEGKHQHPQILLGLLVSVDAYPLAYEIFEGNKFEGHTILPVVGKPPTNPIFPATEILPTFARTKIARHATKKTHPWLPYRFGDVCPHPRLGGERTNTAGVRPGTGSAQIGIQVLASPV